MSAEPTSRLSADEKSFIKAALNGDTSTVRDLLSKGVAVDVRDSETYPLGGSWNITALMCAARNGHVETVQILLQAGASVSAAMDTHKVDGGGGSQALHYAMARGHTAVGALLLDAGADPNAIGSSGNTPLVEAIGDRHLEAVRLLLKRGANVNLKTPRKDLDLPLCAAANAVSETPEITWRGGRVVPAASIIWAEKKPEIFELFNLLLEAGADPSMRSGRDNAPMERILYGYEMPDDIRIPLIESLLKAGAKPNVANQMGTTPLAKAVNYGIPQAVRLLCQAGADVNRASGSDTPLKIAEEALASIREDIATPFPKRMKPEFAAELQERNQRRLQRALAVVDVLREFGASLKPSPLPVAPAKPAVAKPTAPKSKPASPKKALGAAHFLKFIYDGEAEWALFAVKADIESVTEAFSKLHKAKKCDRRVKVKKAAGEMDEVAPLIAVVRVKDNPWTLVYWSLFFVNEAALTGIASSAKELSARFKTESITFAANDTSEAITCEQFENGKDAGSEEFEEGDDNAISKFFKEKCIYLPACYPKSKGKHSWLAVEKVSVDTIERADLVKL